MGRYSSPVCILKEQFGAPSCVTFQDIWNIKLYCICQQKLNLIILRKHNRDRMENYIPQKLLVKVFCLATSRHLCKGLLNCSTFQNLLLELKFFIVFFYIPLHFNQSIFKTVWYCCLFVTVCSYALQCFQKDLSVYLLVMRKVGFFLSSSFVCTESKSDDFCSLAKKAFPDLCKNQWLSASLSMVSN